MHEYVLKTKGLSLERLHLLCEVARLHGIKSAVGDDPARQSLASRQLKELSTYVGCELCKKSGRSLEMTDAGSALALIGNTFFSNLESFLRSVRNLPERFSLGVGDSIFQWQILPRMKDFEKKFPDIQLIPYSYSSDEIIQRVESRELDAGIVRQSAIQQQDIFSKRIGEIHYKLFVPTAYAKESSTPQICELPFCTLTGNGEYARGMATFLSAFNGTPALNCSSMTQMYAAVQSGQYVAVLPEKAASGIPPALIKEFTLPELSIFTRQIAIICKHDTANDISKQAIIDFLSQSIS